MLSAFKAKSIAYVSIVRSFVIETLSPLITYSSEMKYNLPQ